MATKKTIKVDNKSKLPTMAYTDFVDFQGDLKHPIRPENLLKLTNSLKKHGVFVPKFVWFDKNKKANIIDGHQTKTALASLEADGWTIPDIPYVEILAASRKEAGEKLLQVNSKYADVNPGTTWLEELGFDLDEISQAIAIPELDFDVALDDGLLDTDDTDNQGTSLTICPKCGFEYAK